MPGWDTILKFIKAFGLTKGIFTVFFFSAHYVIYKLYMGRLKDRQKEIDRIATENKEYRKKFLSLLDDKFGIKKVRKNRR